MKQQQQAIALLILFCVVTLLIRVQLTQSLFFSFLLWNLFLAMIPYIISEWIQTSENSKIKVILVTSVWLLFLPNAPYLVTDFIHLHHLKSTLVWYDLCMLFSFAATGILLAVISMHTIYNTITKIYTEKIAYNFIIVSSFLSGFGIYLGRFLRLNSWHIFTNTKETFLLIFTSLTKEATWYVSIGFGVFLTLLFYVYMTFKNLKNG